MNIDWITVSAQIINFLILIGLLRYFLYEPVTHAMQAREDRIAEKLSSAEKREQAAQDKAEEYEQKQQDIKQQREKLLEKAEAEAQEQRKKMLGQARDEIDELQRDWQHQVERDKQQFFDELRRRTAQGVYSIARKTLLELADTQLEEQMVHKFIEHLKSADKQTRDALTAADGPLRINSSHELESSARSRLTRAVHQTLGDDLEVVYDETDDLICGIELANGEQRLGWTLANAMADLEEHIENALQTPPADEDEDKDKNRSKQEDNKDSEDSENADIETSN